MGQEFSLKMLENLRGLVKSRHNRIPLQEILHLPLELILYFIICHLATDGMHLFPQPEINMACQSKLVTRTCMLPSMY